MAFDDKSVLLENARIVFRNFAGNEGTYNREGDRNFAVVLDQETGEKMLADGWNVKFKPPREEGEEPFVYLSVKVSYRGRPPRLVMITKSRNSRTVLDEETCELLDYADLETVDLIIRPYVWSVSGKTGTSAYLKTIYATIHEDYLDLKYADVRELDAAERMAIEAAPDYIDGEIVAEYDDEDETKYHQTIRDTERLAIER